MLIIPRLRNSLALNTNSVIPSNSTFASQFFASFHKGTNKFNSNVKGGQGKTPSKSQIRLVVRQRRADTKKALEDFLYKSGSSKHSFLEEEAKLNWKVGLADKSDCLHEKHRSKCSYQNPKKPHQKKNKRKSRRNVFYERFDDHPESTFNSHYESFFRKTESERREKINSKHRIWGNSSDYESQSDDESSHTVGSCANRTLLDLPLTGPLKIDDVKKAFHGAALKWHPDKHQGPSQANAEEKFKQCVDAYKSLCNLISTC